MCAGVYWIQLDSVQLLALVNTVMTLWCAWKLSNLLTGMSD